MADIERARQLRKKETWAEKLMWSWLRGRRFYGYKFRRQHPIGIYYLDFFCEEAELNVELDGSQHGFPDQRKHDVEREKFLTIARHQNAAVLEFAFAAQCAKHPRHDFNELQARAPHPLPEYTQANEACERKVRFNDRPHPGPLLRGEGESFAVP